MNNWFNAGRESGVRKQTLAGTLSIVREPQGRFKSRDQVQTGLQSR